MLLTKKHKANRIHLCIDQVQKFLRDIGIGNQKEFQYREVDKEHFELSLIEETQKEIKENWKFIFKWKAEA